MKQGLLYLLLLLLLSSACSEHTDDINPVQPEENIQLIFIPESVGLSTRSGEEDSSEPIHNLEVLAFEILNEDTTFTYTYGATADLIGSTNNKYQVTLRLSDVPVKLLLIANTELEEIAIGATIEQATKSLFIPFSETGIDYVPMYGEVEFPEGLTGDEGIEKNILLLRSVAAVEVSLKEDLYNNGTFTLKSVQAYRANDQIQIIPDTSSFAVDENTWKVIFPSLPEDVENTITTNRVYADNGETKLAPIYLPESEKKESDEKILTEATCLIVGGIYKDDEETTYYRIDFKTEVKNGNIITGQLLRNHKYTIEITDVSGPGTTHPEEATGAEIKTTIKGWDGGDHPIEL